MLVRPRPVVAVMLIRPRPVVADMLVRPRPVGADQPGDACVPRPVQTAEVLNEYLIWV